MCVYKYTYESVCVHTHIHTNKDAQVPYEFGRGFAGGAGPQDSAAQRSHGDPRVYGRAFVVVGSRAEAVDVKAALDNKPFMELQQGAAVTAAGGEAAGSVTGRLEWAALGDERSLKIHGIHSGQAELDLTVVGCQHLPHKDAMPDPYVVVKYQGYEFETDRVSKNLDPIFGETFVLPVMHVQKPSEITLEVRDWDQSSKQDMIGTYIIAEDEVAALLQAEFDGADHRFLKLYPSRELVNTPGKEVLGHNRAPSVINIRFKARQTQQTAAGEHIDVATDAFGHPAAALGATDALGQYNAGSQGVKKGLFGATSQPKLRRASTLALSHSISVQISEVDHLPKMDAVFGGACDPQVKVSMGAETHKTKHKSNTFRARYTEVFMFEIRSGGRNVAEDLVFEDLHLEVSDYNQFLPNRFIGQCTVPAADLKKLQKTPGATQTVEGLRLLDKKGVVVKGHDGEEATLKIDLAFIEPVRGV